MSVVTRADVLLSFFEYRATYQEPMASANKLYADVPGGLLRALREWSLSLENITYKQNPANLGEASVICALLGGRVGFTVGLGSASLLVKDPNWSETTLVGSICKAGMAGVVASGDVAVALQRATITMHVKPTSGRIRDIVASVLRPADGMLTGGDVRAYGFSLYRDDSAWVVDASVLYPNALFVRIERGMPASIPFDEVARNLRKDEDDLLGLLSLEVA